MVDKLDNSKKTSPQQPSKVAKEIFSWMQSIVVSVIIATLIITFVGRIVRVDGVSMEPNFAHNDRIVTTTLHGDYSYGDVVVIKRKGDRPLIKRIIALGGQTININYETNEVFVDDVLLNEPYIADATREDLGVTMPATVPEGCVFVMGDNRNRSNDSRSPTIGMIDERNIFGKVVFRLFPFDTFGSINFDKVNGSNAAPNVSNADSK